MIIINILLPLAVGLIFIFYKKIKYYSFSVITSTLCLINSILLFFSKYEKYEIKIRWVDLLNLDIVLSNTIISSINIFLASFFTFIIVVFSGKVLENVKNNTYFSFIFFILSFTNLLFLSRNLILVLICWGILGIIVYFMIRFTTQKDEFTTATKTITILGITDFCLFVGIIMFIISIKNYEIKNLALNPENYSIIYTLLIVGTLGKIGIIPFHNWIPDTSEKLPSSINAYLIAAIDKIVGFYLLLIIVKDIFVFKQNILLMTLGSFTVIVGVFMALQQHNLKKLLSYHSISQVGYIIVSIFTGTTLGLIGAIFHMINNTIYKTLLFLSSDMIEKTTKNTELSQPKGLVKFLPYSFVFTFVAALSISGIPPFNGFFSKWIIYQSVIDILINTKSLLIVFVLISLIFGSALTLASFVKVIYSLFLSKSQQSEILQNNKYEKFYSIFPMSILTLLCLIFGILSYEIPISKIIKPMLNIKDISSIGLWNAKIAFYLLVVGFIFGSIIYLITVNKPRKVKNYLLAEDEKLKDSVIPATDFYLTIKETYPFSVIYHFAEQKLLDFYNWFLGIISLLSIIIKKIVELEIFDMYIFGKKVVFYFAEKLSKLHNGNLHFYLSFVFIGILIIFLIFIL